MKKKLLLQFITCASFAVSFKASAQNADEIIFNQYLPQYNYTAGSFVVDTGISQANFQKRAFLIWANNLPQDSLKRYFSLSEYDGNLNFLTEQGNTAEKQGSVKNMFPKKIIKSKFERAYYLLAYVTNSSHKISGFTVYSSPVVFKIDAATLTLKWARKINLSVTAATANTVIEYNDMIETRDKNIVLVGKYAANTQAKEFILSTKLNGSSGALLWQYTYKTGNNCNEAANSVAETTDGNLSLTGYVKKCVPGQTLSGNADVFYMEMQSYGVPVPGAYERFVWPSGLNLWGDKITCYTSSAGSDQLIISGYIDIQSVTGAINRQILIMNLKQNGSLVTAQHIGNTGSDICNDLIFKKNGTSGNDYLIYLTGQTVSTSAKAVGQAYFTYAKFNTATGVGSIAEFSTFPNSLNPNGSRTGVEIKNAGDYKKFAILATGIYQPAAGTTATYSNVLLRDFNDTSLNCIKKQRVPVTQFGIDRKISTVTFDTPFLKIYKEGWIKLGTLFVKEPCQHISIDPSHALDRETVNKEEIQTAKTLRVSPNPAQSSIMLTTADGTKLTGDYKNAVIQVYNYAMQVEKVITVLPSQGGSVQIPVSRLLPGIYRIQLTRGNETLGCSFIKE
jgi:hypothetical protein